jgi:hypothetical protein
MGKSSRKAFSDNSRVLSIRSLSMLLLDNENLHIWF